MEEDLELPVAFGFLAFHGGNLEVGTDAGGSRRPRRPPGRRSTRCASPTGLRWHVPSIEFDPDESPPALRAFLDHVEVAVALHG